MQVHFTHHPSRRLFINSRIDASTPIRAIAPISARSVRRLYQRKKAVLAKRSTEGEHHAMNNLTLKFSQVDAELSKPLLTSDARQYLTESELANRWHLSPKTLQRWRSVSGRGPRFSKLSRTFLYPLDGQNGVLDWEQRTSSRSLPEHGSSNDSF